MALDTLTNVKARLNISGTTYDTFLTAQITLASDVIEAYLRRKLLTASYVQHFYRCDYQTSLLMQLLIYPVSAIASITEDGVTLSSSNYRIHKPTGSVLRTDHTGFFYADETIVTYTAGLSSCPTPVLSVLDSIVQERYNKMVSGVDLNFGANVQRVSIPGALSIDFDNSLRDNDRDSNFGTIIGSNANILDQYRSDRAVLGSSKLVYVDSLATGNP